MIIKDGKIAFTNKWVRTNRLLKDQETKEPIYEFGALQKGEIEPMMQTFDENGSFPLSV